TAARGYHKATGKKIRLVSAESAQSQSQFGGLIAQGIVQPWWLDARSDTPFERVWQAVLGWWPLDVNEPLSPVIPAFTFKFEAKCDVDGTIAYASEKAPEKAQSLVCPKCKAPLIVKTVRNANPRNGITDVGMYIFEGLTEFSAMMMRNMSERLATGAGDDKLGGEVAVRFKDGSLPIAGNTQGQYGTAQSQSKNRVDESKHLYGVDYVWWSAVRAEDKDANAKRVGRVFGPKVAGTAATSDIPRWFGPTLGTAAVPTEAGVEYRLYLTT